MTQTTPIAILDCSATRVIFTTCEHNPADDMEVAVFERMDELGLKMSQCSWMSLEYNNDGRIPVETDQSLQLEDLNY